MERRMGFEKGFGFYQEISMDGIIIRKKYTYEDYKKFRQYLRDNNLLGLKLSS